MHELHDAVVAALSELSPLSREAVIGFYLEGYSYADLAALLNVPVGTLKGRLVFGRRQLRGHLSHWAPEPRLTSLRKETHVEEPTLVPVVIDSVRFSRKTQHRSVVLREQDGLRYLAIFIGEAEGHAIMLGLSGQQLPRPMTHDLSLRLLEPLGAVVQRVAITQITNDTFFADVEVRAGNQTYTVDARPSDALALAVRAGAPVLVAPTVLDQSAFSEEPVDLEHLAPDTPPPLRTTGLLVGMREADQQAIVGVVMGSAGGMHGIHLDPIISDVLAVAREPGNIWAADRRGGSGRRACGAAGASGGAAGSRHRASDHRAWRRGQGSDTGRCHNSRSPPARCGGSGQGST